MPRKKTTETAPPPASPKMTEEERAELTRLRGLFVDDDGAAGVISDKSLKSLIALERKDALEAASGG